MRRYARTQTKKDTVIIKIPFKRGNQVVEVDDVGRDAEPRRLEVLGQHLSDFFASFILAIGDNGEANRMSLGVLANPVVISINEADFIQPRLGRFNAIRKSGSIGSAKARLDKIG